MKMVNPRIDYHFYLKETLKQKEIFAIDLANLLKNLTGTQYES